MAEAKSCTIVGRNSGDIAAGSRNRHPPIEVTILLFLTDAALKH
jgi:hypothetical protein